MKKFFLFMSIILCLLLTRSQLTAQVGVNTDGSAPDSSAMLDVKSEVKGFLLPRMTTAQRDAIVNPASGLQIFNITTNCLEFFVNGYWQEIKCGCLNPPSSLPNPGSHIAGSDQIIWNWNMVSGATGYKVNSVNDYSTATDNFSSTTYTQTGLTCTGTEHQLFVWAYNACGHSGSATLHADLIFRLTIAKDGVGSGLVTSSTSGINCGLDCTEDYKCGTTLALTATPDANSTFAGWSGGCSGTGNCTVLMDMTKNVTATFNYVNFLLTVTKTGTGSGTVTSSPSGIDCGTTCNATYPYGTLITLTATPDANSTFTGWSGACEGTGSCTVTMDMAKSVTATFIKKTYLLTITRNLPGTVISSPAGINCGSTCSATFDAGTVVTLTATPDPSLLFTGWGGPCTGTGSCTITMDEAKDVFATFMYNTLPLTVTRTGTGTGTVTSSPSGINCGSTCSAIYTYGTAVTLTATPGANSTFTGWSGACGGTGSCTVTMDMARSVTATFTKNTYLLTVTKNGPGTVTSSPAGINCGSTCSATYDAGTTVTLTATPDAGATFTGWSGACAGTGSCTVTMDAAKNVTANFTYNTYPLTVSRTGTGTGTVTSNPAGINCGTTCSATYTYGTAVTLTATPDATSTFTGWSGACTGTGSCTVTMDMAKSVTATFTKNTYLLTVTKNGPGTVTSSPSGINCGSTCSTTYDAGTIVTLTATPDAGATFTGWTGACTGTSSCTMTMDAAKNVTANFTYNTYTLTVSRTGTGTGTVTSTPAGISCGATCSATYTFGTAVTLTATPDPNSTFTGWTGACSGTGSCTVTMDMARSVTATFTKNTYLLTVTKNGPGTVTSSPAGINCGSTCSATYDAGTTVTLTATPDAGATFTGWSGACAGTGSCTVTMDAAKNVTANFTYNTYPLTVSRTGTGTGTVTSNPAGINCGTTCSATYTYGTAVTLTATPDATSTFTGWSGACTGTGSCTVTMDMAKSVTATFTKNTYLLTVTKNGPGTVTSSPAGINCGSTCSTTYDAGTMVTLTATPDAGATFTGWTGACTGTGSCTMTMDAAKNVTATFIYNSYPVTVSKTGTGTGTVASSPSGIYCGATCSANFTYGTVVSLSATADANSMFAGWSGACSGTSVCTVTMDAAKNVTASFTRVYYLLSVNKSGPGTVTSSPSGISCGATCSASYDAGTTVTLTATPDAGATFTGWSGACTGTGSCSVFMNSIKNVSATFTYNTYPLTVTKSGTGTGTVTSSPAGISCGTTCSVNYTYGTSVTLVATPDAGSTFTGWAGVCTGTGSCTVPMVSAKSVTATFTLNP